jgi:hypothetical protein
MPSNFISQKYSSHFPHKNEESIFNKDYNQPKIIVNEWAQQKLSFNVLPDRNINESLFIKEYRIWDGVIEAIFDRSYESEMIASPDHLTFLSALINLQKMVYIYMHHHLNIKYDPHGKETLKVWPTELNISLPKLFTDVKDITHRLNVKSIRKLNQNKFYIDADTFIEDSLIIKGKALIIKL